MDLSARSFLKNMADDLAEGILVIGQGGRIVFCNQSAADVFGAESAEIQDKFLDQLMEREPENDVFFDKLIDIVYTKKKTRSNIPFLSGGKLKYLTLTASILRFHFMGEYFVIFKHLAIFIIGVTAYHAVKENRKISFILVSM